MLKYDKWNIPRALEGVPCECGGFAGIVHCTDDEVNEYGCVRDKPGRECCARAFICMVCGTRHVGQAEAPDYDW